MIFPHCADVCVFDITLFVISIPEPAVYVGPSSPSNIVAVDVPFTSVIVKVVVFPLFDDVTVGLKPSSPVSPLIPCGRTKFNVWFGASPVISAEASSPLVTVPIDRVLAGPVSPLSPVSPVSPLSPLSPFSPWLPWGPWTPWGPCGPVSPVSPLSPLGRTKLRVWFGDVPVILALASCPFSTVPMDKVLDKPISPLSPLSPFNPLAPPCKFISIIVSTRFASTNGSNTDVSIIALV